MKQQGPRRVLAVAAFLAVLYFGRGPQGERQVTAALVVLAVAAALLVWYLTRPSS